MMFINAAFFISLLIGYDDMISWVTFAYTMLNLTYNIESVIFAPLYENTSDIEHKSI